MSLEGKTVILFGAGAIASGYAPLFADQAQNVVIVSRGESCERLAEKVRKREGANITGEIIPMHADASDYEQVGGVYLGTVERVGRIDIVVNGAGGNRKEATITGLDKFVDMDPKTVEEIMKSNCYSKLYSLQHFARYLAAAGQGHEGSVVNITSMSGLQPLSRVIPYSIAYAAVENLAQSVAFLYGASRIGRVNNVAVGFTIGEQNRAFLLNEDGSPTERGEEILEATSQKRFLTPEDIAPAVLFLSDSAVSGSVNGATYRVDGGYSLIGLPHTAGYAPRGR